MRCSVSPLIAAFALPLALVAATPSGPARPAARAAAAPTAKSYPEPHPEINAALRALERAKLHLQRAAHDFGGHRVEAIRAIDAAQEQLKLALEYDKN